VTGQTATGGAVRDRRRATFTGSRTGWAPIVVFAAAAAAGLLLAVGPASGQTITSKREQAEAIQAQVESMGMELEQASEAWNYANIQLGEIDKSLALNAKHLTAAKRSLVVAQKRIATRLRDLYVNGQGDSTLEVILGSSSLDDIIARLDAIERVSSQDARILTTVKQYRKEVETRRATLQQDREEQAQIVQEQAGRKQYIESQIGEQNRLLESVKDEIVQMRAEEARRQAALAAQARAQAQAAIAAQQAQQDVLDQAAIDTTYDAPSYDPNLPAPRYGQAVGIALQYLGIPYVWGGSSPSTGFDCSGFVMYVFAQLGVSLPHHAASIWGYGTPVPRDQLAAGDLVFFSGLGHMGIYIGGNQFVHAPHTGDVVKISSMDERWGSYVGARRL
jgi:peptidoglycan DL-endopeptidase CwlO